MYLTENKEINFKELFDMQDKLTTNTLEKRKLILDDIFYKDMLAILVELGEMANEWRGFKYWSVDQKERYDTMLEEYVDCLHFMLTIGNNIENEITSIEPFISDESITKTILDVFIKTTKFIEATDESQDQSKIKYVTMFRSFLGLGKKLNFTFDEIYQGYLDKNKINYRRVANGY